MTDNTNLTRPFDSLSATEYDIATITSNYELFYQKLGLVGEDKKSIRDYIKNIKEILTRYEINT